ncbi:MAG: LPP20 family lipoprotein [Mariniphaga sp.]
MRHLLLLFSLCLTLFSRAQVKPDWISHFPLDNDYYIGIGSCEKNAQNSMECAKSAALESIASAIMVKLQSETNSISKEEKKSFENRFTVNIKTQTSNELEGYELVDTWQDNRYFWVYYRLNKAKYALMLSEKVINEYKISKQFLDDGATYLNSKDISKALSSFLKSIILIMPNLSRPTVADYTSKSWQLFEESKQKVINLLSGIQLSSEMGEIKILFVKPQPRTLYAKAIFKNADGMQSPISNLPIRFTFERGSGRLSDSIVFSNSQGLVTNTLLNINSTNSKQAITCNVSLETILNQPDKNEILKSVLSGNISKARFSVSLEKAMVNINSSELNRGYPVSTKILEPALNDFLKSNGYNVSSSGENADYLITINADTRAGNQVNGICTSYLDLRLTVEDKNGNTIYTGSKSSLKGLKLNYNDAGIDAYIRNLETIKKELFNELISKFSKE